MFKTHVNIYLLVRLSSALPSHSSPSHSPFYVCFPAFTILLAFFFYHFLFLSFLFFLYLSCHFLIFLPFCFVFLIYFLSLFFYYFQFLSFISSLHFPSVFPFFFIFIYFYYVFSFDFSLAPHFVSFLSFLLYTWSLYMKHWKYRKGKIVPAFKGIFKKMEDKATNNYSMQKKSSTF